jgi:hypothetical protein
MTDKPDIYIATPCMTGEVWVGYLKSIIHTFMLLSNSGYKVSHDIMSSNSLIPLARNIMVQDFLDSGAHTLLFIDADLSWEPQAALRLVQNPHDVVSGAYPCKDDANPRWAGMWMAGRLGRNMEASGLPGGFLKVSRRAIKQIIEKHPELKCKYQNREMHAIFDTAIVDGEYLGEDYAFTHRWRQCGGKAFIDPDITFSHYGHKAWTGNLREFLLAQVKEEEEAKKAVAA